jgi:hypothetical protein
MSDVPALAWWTLALLFAFYQVMPPRSPPVRLPALPCSRVLTCCRW